MHNNELIQINIGPIVCFSNYSILFGYNSPDIIIDAFIKNNYKFFPITDINMFSSYQYMQKIELNIIPFYGISLYVNIKNFKNTQGLVYIIFYCQQGYYNFLKIYNNKIHKSILNKSEEIIFNIEEFQVLKNNYGFDIIIGGTKSLLSELINNYIEDKNLKLIVNNFIELCKFTFKNNIIWMVNDLNIEELQYYEILKELELNIIYNYPIVHLDNFYYQNLEVSPHIDMRAIYNHMSIRDLISHQNKFFKNEYFLISHTEFINKAFKLNLLGNTNKFINKLLTYKFKIENTEYLNSYDPGSTREIVLDYTYNNFLYFISNKISKIECIHERIKIGDLYFKRLLSEIYSYDKIQHLRIYQMLYIVCKFINYCKLNQIFIGPGRGSCVGSLLVYLIKITSVDPILHGLIFERFINLSRLSTPDIDIDVSKDQRHLLLKAISEIFKDEFGNKNIVHIIAFSRFIFKMMIKDLIRISSNNIKFVELNNLLKVYDNYDALYKFLLDIKNLHILYFNFIQYISNNYLSNLHKGFIFSIISIILKKSNNIFLVRKYTTNEILNEFINTNTISVFNNLYDKIVKLIFLLENIKKYSFCIKNTGIHAAGILIGGKDFINRIPLYFGSNSEGNLVLCTHLDMDMLSKINVMKFDILGLDNLSIIDHFFKNINLFFDEEEIFNNFILENEIAKKVYNMISFGATKNIFQLEKMHVAKLCNRLKISKFEDIVALNSLNRPGTLDTINNYIDNKKKINYQSTETIEKYYYMAASETYGVVIYQEQIMRLVKIIANYSDSEADVFRAIVSKKKKDLLEQEKVKFIDRCNKNNINKEIANEIFYRIEKFSGYAFNKSHAVAYSKITAITAYLKFNYYIRFNLICIIHKFDKVQKTIESLSEMIINTNIWIKISNLYDDSNIKYESYNYQDNKEDFESIRKYNMIKIFLPAFLIKGIAIDDIENMRENSNKFSIIDIIRKINLIKSKTKILNTFDFFNKKLNVDKLFQIIDNQKTISKFNKFLYNKINNNNLDIFIQENDINIQNLDETSVEYLGFSIIRANIIFIIKHIIIKLFNNNITYEIKKKLTYQIYFVYKIFNNDIGIVRINNFISYKNIYIYDKIDIFDVLLIDIKNNNIITNFTNIIIKNNSFNIFIDFIKKYIKNIKDIIILYDQNNVIKKINLNNNFNLLYQKLNDYYIYDIIIE